MVLVCVTLLLGSANTGVAARLLANGAPLVRVRDVRLPGRTTRFDYQALDVPGRRLYVAHLGDSTLDVLDLDTLGVKAIVPNISQVHGVAVASELEKVYASATGADELVTIDSSTYRVISRTPTGAFPDGVAFDRDHALVVVSNKNAGTLTVIDASTGKRIRTVALSHEVGNVFYNEADKLVYAATRPPDQLLAVDATGGTITTRIPLTGCEGAHGVSIDSAHHRAFVACERSGTVVTVDLEHQRVTGRNRVGTAPDVLAFDAVLGRLYVASESGTVTTFATRSAPITKVGEQRVAPSAHSVSVDPSTHRVFFPLEDVRGHPVLRVMRPKL